MVTKCAQQIDEVRANMRGGQGEVRLTKLMDRLPDNARIFSLITLDQGCSIGYHIHEHETELFYFLSGTAKVLDDGREFILEAGDAMSTGSGHGHGVENAGQEPVRLLAVIVKD